MPLSVIQSTDEIAQSYGNNHKDAWKECNKRLKKNPRDLTSGLWKLRLLSKDLAVTEFTEARNSYCNFALDYDTLSYVQLLTKELQDRSSQPSNTAGPEIQNAWFKRADADPDKRLPGYHHMFETAYACQHWKDAQVAMSKLKAKFPDRLDFYFAYVALSQLAAENEETGSKTAEMDAKLANMFVTQALQNIKKPAARVKADDPRHLRLAVQILKRQGKTDELLKILDDADIGIQGPIAKTDWEFVRFKIDALDEKKAWTELFGYCRALLEEDSAFFTNASGDWAVWSGLQRAAAESEDSSLVDQIKGLYDTWKSQHPNDWRNPWLAYSKTLVAIKDAPEGALLHLCEDYFTKYGTLYRAFDDLREPVGRLSPTDCDKFRKIREDHGKTLQPGDDQSNDKAQAKWYACQVNNLKLDYLACVQKPTNTDAESLEDIVCRAVILHHQKPEVDYIVSQDCCILAVTGLVHLAALEQGKATNSSQRYLLQALYLLETLFRFIKAGKGDIPDNRHAKLILGVLALRLGLGTYAIGVFPEVKIKDAIADSLSHYLFVRISTLHPFPSQNQWGSRDLKWDTLDPTKLLTSAINTYASASARLRPYEYDDRPNARTMMTVQYDSLLEMAGYTNSLRASTSRVQWTLERRRIRRLRGTPTKSLDEAEELEPNFLTRLSDNRSFGTLPNYEPAGLSSFTQHLLAAPQPGAIWIASTLLAEESHALILGELNKLPHDSRLRLFQDARVYLESQPPDALEAELTPAEQAVLPLWRQLRPLALRLAQPEDTNGIPLADANAAFKQLATWMTGQQDTLRALLSVETEGDDEGALVPDRAALQTFYLTLEALRAIHGAVDLAEGILKKSKSTHALKGTLNAAAVSEARTAAAKTAEVLRDKATSWRGRLVMAGEERIRKIVGEGKVGAPLLAVGGDLRAFSETVKAAALDALAAVLSVKVL